MQEIDVGGAGENPKVCHICIGIQSFISAEVASDTFDKKVFKVRIVDNQT